MQVPLLTVLESVTFERVRGRSPLFQSWFDIQPLSLESDLSLEGLEAVVAGKVRLSRIAAMLRPSGACNGCISTLSLQHWALLTPPASVVPSPEQCLLLLGALRILCAHAL